MSKATGPTVERVFAGLTATLAARTERGSSANRKAVGRAQTPGPLLNDNRIMAIISVSGSTGVVVGNYDKGTRAHGGRNRWTLFGSGICNRMAICELTRMGETRSHALCRRPQLDAHDIEKEGSESCGSEFSSDLPPNAASSGNQRRCCNHEHCYLEFSHKALTRGGRDVSSPVAHSSL